MIAIGGTLFGDAAHSNGQLQEPPKFKKPSSYRSLLGVRTKPSQGYGAPSNGYGSNNQATQHAARIVPQNRTRSVAPIRQIGLGNQPVGTGVRQQRVIARRSVEPINDPFGDLESPSRETQQLVATRVQRSSVPQSKPGMVRPASRTAIVPAGQQESILRRPANSRTGANNASRSNSAPGNTVPGSFSLEPRGNEFMQQGRPQEQVQPQVEQPMNAVPMNSAPMNSTPPSSSIQENQRLPEPGRRSVQDEDVQQRFELDCDEINGVILRKSIRDIALNMKPNMDPRHVAPQECDFAQHAVLPRNWESQTFNWTASAACSKPLYYQHIQLERYGHTRGPILQPILSGVHFFGNVLIHPYKAGIHPPNECMYALGYYRPGDCAPWLREPFPWSFRGAASQACFGARSWLMQ